MKKNTAQISPLNEEFYHKNELLIILVSLEHYLICFLKFAWKMNIVYPGYACY